MDRSKTGLSIFAAVILLSMLACNFVAQPTTPAPTSTAMPSDTALATDTPKPSETPNPTNTPKPSDVPAANSTPTLPNAQGATDSNGVTGNDEVPDGVLGVSKRSIWKFEIFGTWQISGLVVNNTGQSFENILVEIEIFDANDNAIYQETVETALGGLAPGETSTFLAEIIADEVPYANSFTATVIGQDTMPEEIRRPAYVIENSFTFEQKYYTFLTGEVVNLSDRPLRVRGLAAAQFDNNGTLVSAVSGADRFSYIKPGERGPFSIMIDHPEDTPPGDYVIYPDIIETEAIQEYAIEISEQKNLYQDTAAFRSYHLVGSLTSRESDWLSFDLDAAIYDSDGKVLEVTSFMPSLRPVGLDEEIPFDITGWSLLSMNDSAAKQIATIKVSVAPSSVYTYYSYKPARLSVSEGPSSVDERKIIFTGTLTNDSDVDVSISTVAAILYEKGTKNIIAFGTDYTGEIKAEGSVSYEIYVFGPAGIDLDTVDVVILPKGEEE